MFQNIIIKIISRTLKLKLIKKLVIGINLLITVTLFGQQLPYQNANISEERAGDLLSRLTLEEKAALMCDQSDAIPRLGIKKFNWWSRAIQNLDWHFDKVIAVRKQSYCY